MFRNCCNKESLLMHSSKLIPLAEMNKKHFFCKQHNNIFGSLGRHQGWSHNRQFFSSSTRAALPIKTELSPAFYFPLINYNSPRHPWPYAQFRTPYALAIAAVKFHIFHNLSVHLIDRLQILVNMGLNTNRWQAKNFLQLPQ